MLLYFLHEATCIPVKLLICLQASNCYILRITCVTFWICLILSPELKLCCVSSHLFGADPAQNRECRSQFLKFILC